MSNMNNIKRIDMDVDERVEIDAVIDAEQFDAGQHSTAEDCAREIEQMAQLIPETFRWGDTLAMYTEATEVSKDDIEQSMTQTVQAMSFDPDDTVSVTDDGERLKKYHREQALQHLLYVHALNRH